VIHPIGDIHELADELRAERQWNEGARADLLSMLEENKRMADELAVARREIDRLHRVAADLQRDLTDARHAELARWFRASPYLRGEVA